MRIIAGRYRRRPLKAPKGFSTRPSTDRIRESLFNLIASRMDLEAVDVLDLFAGSGALGLEALSRGARSAVFVESNPRVLQCARQNAESLEAIESCRFVRAEVLHFLARYNGAPFDLILADPPYGLPGLQKLPAAVLPHVAQQGLFALEHDRSNRFEDHPRLSTSRAYGRSIVSIFAPDS